MLQRMKNELMEMHLSVSTTFCRLLHCKRCTRVGKISKSWKFKKILPKYRITWFPESPKIKTTFLRSILLLHIVWNSTPEGCFTVTAQQPLNIQLILHKQDMYWVWEVTTELYQWNRNCVTAPPGVELSN